MSVSLEQLKGFPRYANKSNPIHRAAARGDIEFLQTLRDNLDLKKIKMRDSLGATPIHVAAREEKIDCLEWLLANTNLSVTDQANAGETPLHVAAARGHVALLQMLVRHANSDTPEGRAAVLLTPDNNTLTALHLAALKGHQSVVNWIVMEYKPHVAPLMETGRVTPAHLAASAGHTEVLRTLLSSANRFNGWAEARDTEGTPIAYFAAQQGKLGCLQFLLEELSADPKAVASEGMTAMHAAAQSGHDVIIRYYVERLGSDVINWRTEDGGIPLHFAAGMGHSSTVTMLLGYDETGMSVTATDNKLVTPLHETLQLGKVECARILIDAGADVTADDSSGRSALSIVSQDAFHPCHAVVMQASRGSVSEETQESDEEPVRNKIPKARTCIEQVQPDIIAEDPEPVDRASLRSNQSEMLSSHSSKTTSLSDNHLREVSSQRSSLAEHSYLLSPLLTDPPPPATAQLDKFLAGMGRRTARRQLRWLARPDKVQAPLPLTEELDPPTFEEQIQLASECLQPSASELPKRRMGSLVLERMNLLGGSLHQGSKPQAEVPLVTEEGSGPSPEPFVSKYDLPADIPVSEELQFFYGKESEAAESLSESTLLSEESPTPEPVPDVATTPDQSESSLSETVESVTADDVTSHPSPALGLPEPEILPGDQTGDKPKKSRFSGLRRIGRLLGRKDREEDGGDGATFEAIMQRNLIIQEQIRSAPYPLLPPGVLEPISASTGLREPAEPPVWRPEELLMEERSSDSPEPPSSTTDTSPHVTARLIRPSVEETRPISTSITIDVSAPYVLTESPSFPFTTNPAEEQDTPTRDPETFLYGRQRDERVSNRIANLTQSLLGATTPVTHPYTPHTVYQSSQPVKVKPSEPIVNQSEPVARPELQETPVPLLKPEVKERPAAAPVTTSYDVPSWEEAREYLRRVTARQKRGPREEEEDEPLVRNEEETQEPKLSSEPPPISRSPALSDLSAAAEPLKDRDSSPARRKLTPGVTSPSPGTQVFRLKEKFSQIDPIRPQHLRISPPNPGKPFQKNLERVPAATRPVRHSSEVKKLPALREEVSDVSDLLRDMFLSKAGPGDEVVSKPGPPTTEGGPVGRGSLKSEVQELSLSGQVKDRLKRFNPGS